MFERLGWVREERLAVAESQLAEVRGELEDTDALLNKFRGDVVALRAERVGSVPVLNARLAELRSRIPAMLARHA